MTGGPAPNHTEGSGVEGRTLCPLSPRPPFSCQCLLLADSNGSGGLGAQATQSLDSALQGAGRAGMICNAESS